MELKILNVIELYIKIVSAALNKQTLKMIHQNRNVCIAVRITKG